MIWETFCMEESCSMWMKLKNIWRINMSNEIVFDQFFLLQGGLSITEVHKYFILWGENIMFSFIFDEVSH